MVGKTYKQEPVVHKHHRFMAEDPQSITLDIWGEKYKRGEERVMCDSKMRVAEAIANGDAKAQKAFENVLTQNLLLPGGRINAGAGSGLRVTLHNCFVSQTISDSMVGIAEALKDSMLTMQQGGGMGHDFSTLRPEGANLERTGAPASGPGPFMDMWDSMCQTIMSAGFRRGAMMGTLCDSHPFLPKFIIAKQDPNRWRNFNVSVLISDAFIDAVRYDEEWALYFPCIPHKKDHVGEFTDEEGVTQYIYSKHQARDLWNAILQNTYDYAEPGVIFIDRVNDLNNLQYCETIYSTNPCAEEPLPPYGACDLGAVNLAVMVDNPFEVDAQFRWDLLKSTVHTLVEFLDNVIDVSGYPLEQQEQEQKDKRRIGLGITGLADAMVQLRVRYGSQEAVMISRKIMRFIAHEAYTASALLAKEKGTFELYDPKWLEAPFVQKLDTKTQALLKKNGSRNGVILTIAPVGTGSIYYGNISSGLEPIFAHEQNRKVRQADDSWKEYLTESYAFRLYKIVHNLDPDVLLGQITLPDYMATAQDITVDEHLNIQAAVQEWVDASVSKTINCPKDLPFDEFAAVYDRAYDSGCKGCTTYRPSPVRGQILSDANVGSGDAAGGDIIPESKPDPRPEVLPGKTYKIKWPSLASSLYLTVNRDEHDQPFEVFISSKSSVNADWMTAVSLLITAIMRMQKGISFLPEELKSIHSAHDGAWIGGVYYGSLIGYIGHVLERALIVDENEYEDVELTGVTSPRVAALLGKGTMPKIGAVYLDGVELCPKCGNPAFIHQEGCKVCRSCGFSSCD